MRFWYTNNRQELQSLQSVLMVEEGKKYNSNLPEELQEIESVDVMSYGLIREYNNGYILEYSEEYSNLTELSVMDIKINELIK